MQVEAGAAAQRSAARVAGARLLESLDAATLAVVRCVLASCALVVVWVEPSDPQSHSTVTQVFLCTYLLYSFFVAWLSDTRGWGVPPRWQHWADLVFYSFLLTVTGGTQGIFFMCFLFPVMVAAVSYGAREGHYVIAVAIGAYLSLGLATTHWTGELDPQRLLLGPAYLLVLGYTVAYLGGRELDLKRQLVLLHSLNALGSPRAGADVTAAEGLRRLREHYDADRCVLLTFAAAGEAPTCYTSSRAGVGDADVRASLTTPAMGTVVSRLSEYVLTVNSARGLLRKPRCIVSDVIGTSRRSLEANHPWCRDLPHLLGAPCILSAPYEQHDGVVGCVIVAAPAAFSRRDAAFLLQFAAAFGIILEHTGVIEELVTSASEKERSRISLDIHDTTIQPYIGLRIALQALYRDTSEESGFRHRVRELIEMADLTVADLRRYAADLRGAAVTSEHVLLDAIKEQAERYHRFFGLKVDVEIDVGPRLGDLASDVFQIVLEGLSNIRKHTSATHASVRIMRDPLSVRIRIANEISGEAPAKFNPRSIEHRAKSLGGSVSVGNENGRTLVDVSVPI